MRQWQEFPGASPDVRFKLIPPEPDRPGVLAIITGTITRFCRLFFEPAVIAVQPAICPCCGRMLAVRLRSDGSIRLRSLALENRLAPADKDDIPFGPPASEEEEFALADEYRREEH
jgi:hypothetical protein